MELYLQFGHGMKSLAIELSKKWGGLTTILSPRDMAPNQLTKWCSEFKKSNIKTLFDPQCYCPKSEQSKLIQYEYWNNNLTTQLGADETYSVRLIKSIKKYNDIANTVAFIIPNVLDSYDGTWINRLTKRTNDLIASANQIVKDKPIFATLTLPNNFLMQREDETEKLIEEILTWDVDGFYIIAETPNKQYLVDNPLWLSNVVQICAALKIANKKVIYGYGNHQMLFLSLIKIDALASGTWLNVRSFTNRFIDSDEMKRKSTWIYYPQALSEYKLAFVDSAYSNGSIELMKPSKEFSNEYSEQIFRPNALPSTTGLTETIAFKYYLCCLKRQFENLEKPSYNESLSANELQLSLAERAIEQMEKQGIYAQARSFRDIVDINRSAIQRLNNTRGFSLNMSWLTL